MSKILTPAAVRRRVKKIAKDAEQSDFESTHYDEDKLYADVLRTIAGGTLGETSSGLPRVARG